MIRKLVGFVLILSIALSVVVGCDVVKDIAGNVLEAAKTELTAQIQSKLEEFKLQVVEVKPLVGKLNDEGGEHQFYCAALVRTNAESSAEDCAKALQKVFGEAGHMAQADSKVESEHLVHKTITYKQTDYAEGNYYTLYVYVPAIEDIIDLEALAEKLKQ